MSLTIPQQSTALTKWEHHIQWNVINKFLEFENGQLLTKIIFQQLTLQENYTQLMTGNLDQIMLILNRCSNQSF